MNEQEMNQGIDIGNEAGTAFNGGELDLGSAEIEIDPFGENDFADEEIPGEEPEKPTPPKANPALKTATPSASSKTTVPANPLEKAVDEAETKDATAAQKSPFT